MELRQIRYFLAVAETLHFHQAAAKLHLSQPSLSLQISQLEEELGFPLFERTRRRVVLTPAGMELVPRFRQMLVDLTDAVQHAQRTHQGLAGQLVIGFISSAMAGALPKALRTFQSQVPEVTLELQESSPEEQIQGLLKGTVDVAFIHADMDDEGLSTLTVQSDTLIMALPQNIAPEAAAVDLADYAHHASIMPAPFRAFGIFAHIQRAYQMAGVVPAKILHTNLIIGGINSVSSGIGIALVPSIFRNVQIPGVTYRDLTQQLPPIRLHAVWRRDDSSRQLLRLIEILRQQSEWCK